VVSPSPPIPRFRSRLQEGIYNAFELDLRSLAAFRISLALLLFYDLATRAADFSAHYTEAGVLPQALNPEPGWSLYLWSTHTDWQWALLGLTFLSTAALLVGWRTRLATLATWVLMVSLHMRNPLVCYAADDLLGLLLLWGSFLPLGARWSVDARRMSSRATEHAWFSWAGVGLVVQICLIYVSAAASKIGPAWLDGTAVFYVFSIHEYVTPFGSWLRDHMPIAGLTYGTLLIEWLAPVLLLGPRTGPARWGRTLALAALFGLQTCFWLSLDIGIFPATNLVALVALLPREFWRDTPTKRPGRQMGTSRLSKAGASLLIASALTLNIDDAVGPWEPLEPAWDLSAHAPFPQGWSMFAPNPMQVSGWYVIDALQITGERIDLLRNGEPVEALHHPRALPSDRWKEYLMVLTEIADPRLTDRTLAWMAQQWNDTHEEGEAVKQLSFLYCFGVIAPPGEDSTPPECDELAHLPP
jgi:hypothetical protein